MSDYTKTTNFTAKDNLPTGSVDKIIKGSLFDTEFDNIAAAISTKANTNDLPDQYAQVVSSISDLRNVAPVNGRVIYLKYHTNEGDGGHGIFRGVTGASAGTYTDDNGITIVPTGGDGSSAWIRLHDDLIDVKWYGASSSGSASSNTTAIQKAIDNNAGKVIVITRGIPYTRSSLTGISGSGGVSLLDLSRNDETAAGLDIYPHLSVGGDIDMYPFSGGNPELTFKKSTGYSSGVDGAIIYYNPDADIFGIKYYTAVGSAADIFRFNTNSNTPDPTFTKSFYIDKSSGNIGIYYRENGADRCIYEYNITSNQINFYVRNATDTAWVLALSISGEDNNPAVIFPELSAKPAAPSSGIKLYARNAGAGVKLYAQDPSGTETALT